MTDIKGNYGVYSHAYKNEISKEEESKCSLECDSSKDECACKETNLDNSAAAISGRAMVNKTKKGDYQFDPKNVERDVRELQRIYDVTQENTEIAAAMVKDYYNDLINSGVSKDLAYEKTTALVDSLAHMMNRG